MLWIKLHLEDYPFQGTKRGVGPRFDEKEAFWVYNHSEGIFFDGEQAYELAARPYREESGFSSDGMRRTGGEYMDYVPGEPCQDVPVNIIEDLKVIFNMPESERRRLAQVKAWKINAAHKAAFITKTTPIMLCHNSKTLPQWKEGIEVGWSKPDEEEQFLMEALGLVFVPGAGGHNLIKTKEKV